MNTKRNATKTSTKAAKKSNLVEIAQERGLVRPAGGGERKKKAPTRDVVSVGTIPWPSGTLTPEAADRWLSEVYEEWHLLLELARADGLPDIAKSFGWSVVETVKACSLVLDTGREAEVHCEFVGLDMLVAAARVLASAVNPTERGGVDPAQDTSRAAGQLAEGLLRELQKLAAEEREGYERDCEAARERRASLARALVDDVREETGGHGGAIRLANLAEDAVLEAAGLVGRS